MSSPPEKQNFVLAHVLDRLISGRFVADRKPVISLKDAERRQVFSPLNVTRRAIRYEPLVFSNRKELIIQSAQILNDDQHKLLMVSGPSGRGKTAFVRGLAELLGGGSQQLLWFDVSKHTDQDEIIRFLIEYMTYVCREFGQFPDQEIPANEDPVDSLMSLLEQSSHIPILIVIDNVELLVSNRQTLRSVELKDTLNFLLSYDNVKLIFSGTQMPLSDMSPLSPVIYHLELPTFDEAQSWTLIERYCDTSMGLLESEYRDLLRYTRGEPYAVYLLSQYTPEEPDYHYWKSAFERYNQDPYTAFLEHVVNQSQPKEAALLGLLSLIRHGVTPTGLKAIVAHCIPELRNFSFESLEQSNIAHLMQKVYPPQLVLDQLRNRQRDQAAMEQGQALNTSIEAFYQLWDGFRHAIAGSIQHDVLGMYHIQLQQFYIDERNKPLWQRVYRARTRHLLAEAQFHGNELKRIQREESQQDSAVPPAASVLERNPLSLEAMASAYQPSPVPQEPDDPDELQAEEAAYLDPLDVQDRQPLPQQSSDISPSIHGRLSSEYEEVDEYVDDDDDETDESELLEELAQMEAAEQARKRQEMKAGATPPTVVVNPVIQLNAGELVQSQHSQPTEAVQHVELKGSQGIIPQDIARPVATPEKEPEPAEPENAQETTPPQAKELPVPAEPTPQPEMGTRPEQPRPLHWLESMVMPYAPVPPMVGSLLKASIEAIESTDPIQGCRHLAQLLKVLSDFRHPAERTPAQSSALDSLYKRAIQHLLGHGELLLSNPQAHQLLICLKKDYGAFCLEQEDDFKAFEVFTDAYKDLKRHPIEIPELKAEILARLGDIQVRRHQWRPAIKTLLEAQKCFSSSHPQKAEVWFQLALCFEACQKIKQAVNAYHQSYKLSKHQNNTVACAATLYNLGCLYFEYQAFDKALKIFEKGLGYDQQTEQPKDQCRTLIMLSKVCEALNRVEAAKQYAEMAIQIASENQSYQLKIDPKAQKTLMASAWLRLGYLSEKTQDSQRAYEYYTQAKTIGQGALPQASLDSIDHKLAAMSSR